MKNFLRKKLEKIILAERSVNQLAFSSAVAVAVAFSPFLGIQTILLLIIGAILRVNMAVAMLILYLVNNPLTMIPILALDYLVGVRLGAALGVSSGSASPAWVQSFNDWFSDKICYFLGTCGITQIDLWSFMVGGSLFALIIGLVSYPLARIFFTHILKKFPVS